MKKSRQHEGRYLMQNIDDEKVLKKAERKGLTKKYIKDKRVSKSFLVSP